MEPGEIAKKEGSGPAGWIEAMAGREGKESVLPGDDHEDVPEVREDFHAPGGGPALAGLVPGVQGPVSAGGGDHADLPGMRAELHLFFRRWAMAEILPGMSGEEKGTLT